MGRVAVGAGTGRGVGECVAAGVGAAVGADVGSQFVPHVTGQFVATTDPGEHLDAS